MKALGLMITVFALAVCLLPGLTAQEKKADDAKAEKKDAKAADKKDTEKKDATKKDENKDPEKKTAEKKTAEKDEKKKKAEEERVVYGQTVVTKIVSMRPESAHEFSVEMKQLDPERVAAFQLWAQQQQFNLSRNPNPQALIQFQIQMQQKQATDIYSNKVVDVRAVDGIKVRSMYPPQVFDDRGNVKKWTAKELAKLKGTSKLKGYPSDMDALKIGQIVELYFAKTTPPVKTAAAGLKGKALAKKKIDDDDDPAVAKMQPEVVMIVILAEPMQQP